MSQSRSMTNRHSPRRSDSATLLAVALAALLTLGLGYQTHQLPVAGVMAGVSMLLAVGAFVVVGGTTRSRYLLTFAAFGVACSHIYLSAAQAESYVGIILLGCLLPQYRDWKLVAATGVAALAFHLLWSVDQPGHAATLPAVCALTLQYGYMAYAARREALNERERFELAFLNHAMGAEGLTGGGPRKDRGWPPPTSPAPWAGRARRWAGRPWAAWAWPACWACAPRAPEWTSRWPTT